MEAAVVQAISGGINCGPPINIRVCVCVRTYKQRKDLNTIYLSIYAVY